MSQEGRRPSQVLRTPNKTSNKTIAIAVRERIDNEWVWIWNGRGDMKFYFLLFVGHYRDYRELTLVKTLILCWLLSILPESPLQALVSARIW